MESLLGIDLVSFITTAGYLGLFFIIFSESGLFIGFFLPGDSLLFTAGFLASQGYMNIWILTALCFAGAVLGDNFGYAFGKKTGLLLFRREDSLLFKKSHLERARKFYEAHGGKTLVLARFMPVIRTFAPILAGVGHMSYRTFLFYNLAGGALWAIGLTMLGYFLGSVVPNVDQYLIPIILVIITLSAIPGAVQILREVVRERREEKEYPKDSSGVT